jgi:hypothetical protein
MPLGDSGRIRMSLTPLRTRLVRTAGAIPLMLVPAACGGPTAAPGTHSPAASSAPLTAAAARTIAEAAILTQNDLPGSFASPITRDASADAADEKLETCLGLAPASYLTRNYGKSFSQRTVEFESSADVRDTVAAARSRFSALNGPDGTRCMKATLSTSLTILGAAVASASLTPVSLHVPGSDASFGFRFSVTATVQGKTGKLTGFELGSLVGQVEIHVGVVTFGGQPVGLDRAAQLLSTATTRVRSAS